MTKEEKGKKERNEDVSEIEKRGAHTSIKTTSENETQERGAALPPGRVNGVLPWNSHQCICPKRKFLRPHKARNLSTCEIEN